MKEELAEVNKIYNIMIDFIANYSLQIVGALIILIIGIIASKYIQKFILKILLKNNIDITLSNFISNFIRFLVIAMMVILALGKLGISIAPFIAALGAISLTAGLALQGSVSNFAAGVVLIITKPFKIGDTITIHDVYGEVVEIKLSYTVLLNEDKEQITVPNKYMIGDVLVNSFKYRIVEGSVGIAYDSDISNTIKVIEELLQNTEYANSDNIATVGIEKFNDSSIDIAYRYWVPTNAYFKTQYEVNLKIIEAFREKSINIPFPQRELKIIGETDVS